MQLFSSLKHQAFLLFAATSFQAFAGPWVDTNDAFLRESIEHLADVNIVTTPTTTFPLMWRDIAKDLEQAPLNLMDEQTLTAYSYVNHQLRLAKKNTKRIELNLATKDARFTSFGDKYRDKNTIQIHNSFMTDRFAFNFSPKYTSSPSDDDKVTYDGSYAAAFIGNWVVAAGMQDRWWGPGWDTSLSLSNNARPMPALSLSRLSAEPVTVPFTEHNIPWTVTTFMGLMNDDRIVDDTLLWGFRLNFRPAQNWEVGISRLAQWAGDGRPSGLDTFVDVLAGRDNCGGVGPSVEECAAGEEPGNQLAGYDIRYSTKLLDHPVALYFTAFAEDGDSKGGLSILGEERYQAGIDTRATVFGRNWRLFAEWTDTYAKCRDGVNGDGTSAIGDCYYEHHIYQTGVRYKGRVLGNLYENDATSIVFGAISQVNNDLGYQFKLRWLELNQDNNDKAPNNPLIGNTLTPIAEDVVMLSGKVQYSYQNWRFTLDADVSQSSFENDIDDDTDANLSVNIEFML
ncbi:capsule assembly Wzi family protein [Thalassotalea euphylliae]|uniref:Capsule assembly Wzi family protein n=1 Tax=Thalassotalea euphylliae TaxID=1655234 RepID=A0A3E0UIN9_9GAMM|nr:capsule assembly Wzi family protein [Thalassotalea euphylliae]REL36487.1 capsule assembly Wzi family protein [Thalassotalea euphylliae]